MKGTTHRIAGAITGLAYSYFTHQSVQGAVIITVASIVGSLVPDIDEPHSIIGRKVKLASKLIKKIFGHRGMIHSPLFMLLSTVGLKYLLLHFEFSNIQIILVGYFLGYLSHLILDTFTPMGINWFFPFGRK